MTKLGTGTLLGSGSPLGGVTSPFRFYVNLMDANGARLARLDDKVKDFTWNFRRLGGCDTASFTIHKTFEQTLIIDHDYRIDIWINGELETDYRRVWQGYVVGLTPTYNNPDYLTIRCNGFAAQMNRIIIGKYEALEFPVGTLPKNVLMNLMSVHIIPYTDIASTAKQLNTYIDPITLETMDMKDFYIKFSGMKALDCISQIAMLAGDWEWGVNAERLFYCRPSRSSDVTHYWYASNLTSYEEDTNYDNIRNRVYVSNSSWADSFERTSDIIEDQVQIATNRTVALVDEYNLRIKQTFKISGKSISRISILPAGFVGNPLTGSGWTELISDWDMESETTDYWPATNADLVTAAKSKMYNVSAGDSKNKSLKIQATVSREGVKQELKGLLATSYTINYYYKILEGDLEIYVKDSSETVLVTSNKLSSKAQGASFRQGSITFTMPAAGDATLYIVSYSQFDSIFFVDNVTMLPAGRNIKLYLVDNADPDEKPLNNNIIIKDIYELLDSTELTFDLHHYEGTPIETYAFIIERADTSANVLSNNFFFYMQNPSSLADADLYLWSFLTESWAAFDTVPSALWFKTYQNQSQELYGLTEELQANQVNDPQLVQEYMNSYLSTVDRPWKRASLTLNGLRDVIEKDIPDKTLGRVRFRGPGESGGGKDAFTRLLLHMGGVAGGTSFGDGSWFSQIITSNGGACKSAVYSKFGGLSAYFDGVDDYLSITKNQNLVFGTQNFCIDFWINFSSVASTQCIFNTRIDGNNADQLSFVVGSGITFVSNRGGVSNFAVTTTFVPTVGVWNHIVLYRDPASCHLWINGLWRGYSTGPTIVDLTYLDVNPEIGRRSSNNDRYFNGYIDEFRISIGTSRFAELQTNQSFPVTQRRIPMPTEAYSTGITYPDLEIESIAYAVTDAGTGINCTISSGEAQPHLAKLLKQLEYKIQLLTSDFGS